MAPIGMLWQSLGPWDAEGLEFEVALAQGHLAQAQHDFSQHQAWHISNLLFASLDSALAGITATTYLHSIACPAASAWLEACTGLTASA
jgi:hypothetical protein